MDYVQGSHLSDILKKPTLHNEEKEILNPDIDDMTLDIVYRQIADFMLQLYEFSFTQIGSISEDCCGSNTWSVAGRPLTYHMNELAVSSGYPVDQFHKEPFTSVNEYFRALADQHLIHLRTQRNLTADPEDTRRRYVARHLFAQLAARNYVDDSGLFKLFCDDLRPANILVDEKTLQIAAVLDLEYTNAMPAQFAHEPPWWLLLVGPDMWLERGHTMEEFVSLYESRLEQFLWALEQVEEQTNRRHHSTQRLSSLMLDSWESGDFWFNFAARKSLDVDAIFYTQLDRLNFGGNAGIDLLDDEARARIDSFAEMKMSQKEAYDEQFVLLYG